MLSYPLGANLLCNINENLERELLVTNQPSLSLIEWPVYVPLRQRGSADRVAFLSNTDDQIRPAAIPHQATRHVLQKVFRLNTRRENYKFDRVMLLLPVSVTSSVYGCDDSWTIG